MAAGAPSTLPAGKLTVGTISSQGQPGSTSAHSQPWDQGGCFKPQLITCFAGLSPGHTVTGELLQKQTQMWSLECKMFLSGQHLQKEGDRSRTSRKEEVKLQSRPVQCTANLAESSGANGAPDSSLSGWSRRAFRSSLPWAIRCGPSWGGHGLWWDSSQQQRQILRK